MNETVVKKKAPSPNADKGKAVALPRWFGQFNAAEVVSMDTCKQVPETLQVLIEPEKAAAPPMPVRKVAKHNHGRAIEPGPPS